MLVEESLRSKKLYKILLLTLKLLPMLVAFCCCLNTILAYFNIETTVLSMIGGMSLFTLTFVYLAAIVFKFCIYHRMFLHYVLVSDIIDIIDYYIGIPISEFQFIMLHTILVGITLFLILYLYVKTNKRVIKTNNR